VFTRGCTAKAVDRAAPACKVTAGAEAAQFDL
jgi:hypothetical protein